MKLIERSHRSTGFKLWVFYVIACCCQTLDTLIPVLTVGKYTGHFGVWWMYYSKLGSWLEGDE